MSVRKEYSGVFLSLGRIVQLKLQLLLQLKDEKGKFELRGNVGSAILVDCHGSPCLK